MTYTPDEAAAWELIDELRRSAEHASATHKMMADAKTARQSDPDSCYDWLKPEETVEGRAASLIEHLLAASQAETKAVHPIDMVLHCPRCGLQHIDEPDERSPDWENPPHRSHLCHGCGCIWRPADVATNGVRGTMTVGKADNWNTGAACPTKDVGEDVVERVARQFVRNCYDQFGKGRRGHTAFWEDVNPRFKEEMAGLARISALTVLRPENATISVDDLAAVVHRARFWPEDKGRQTPFEQEDERGKEYCRRIARAAIAAIPPSPDADAIRCEALEVAIEAAIRVLGETPPAPPP